MTDTTDREVKQFENGAGDDDQANILEQIRQRRRELLQNRQTYIPIPGYDDIGLVAQYHLLDGKEMTRIVDKVQRQTKNKVERGVSISIDTFIAACDGLYLNPEDGVYVPFDPGRTGSPLQYDPSLSDFLGLDAPTARAVVRGLFGENDAAIAMHSMKLNRWFQDTSKSADDEFLGEF